MKWRLCEKRKSRDPDNKIKNVVNQRTSDWKPLSKRPLRLFAASDAEQKLRLFPAEACGRSDTVQADVS